jgi:hypothetical protein
MTGRMPLKRAADDSPALRLWRKVDPVRAAAIV